MKKWLFFALGCVGAVLLCAACGNTADSPTAADEITEVTGSDTVEPVSSASEESPPESIFLPEKSTGNSLEGTYSTYDSLKEMYEDAYAVVIGDVVKADESFLYHDLVDIALSDVKVIASVKGDLSAGDVISIEETGARSEDGDFSIEAVPLLQENERVMLFLTEPSDVIQGDTLGYGILGCYQGKFFMDAENQVYPSSYFSDHAVSIPDCGEVMTLTEMDDILGVASASFDVMS